MANNYPLPDSPNPFLVILRGDEGDYMELMNESRLAFHVDGADFLPVSVQSIFVLREGKLVKCEFGPAERLPQSSDNEARIIYAYTPLYANGEQVASIPLTDH